MSAEWLELLRCSEDNVTLTVRDLQILSHALARVGLDKPADEIMEISWQLAKAKEDIRKAINLKLSSDVKDARSMSSAVLNATIAGCIVGAKEKGKTVKKK